MWRAAARPFPLASGPARGYVAAAAHAGAQSKSSRCHAGLAIPSGSGHLVRRPLLSRGPGVVPLCRQPPSLPPCGRATARRWGHSAARHDAESSDDECSEDDPSPRAGGSAASSSLKGDSKELDAWAGSDEVLVHVHSRPSWTPFELSELKMPGGQVPEEPPGWAMRFVSATGMKSSESPNQDAFSYTQLVGGWLICIACDGHGEHGQIISERVARTLPMLLAPHLAAAMEVEEALRIAFIEAQSDLESSFMMMQVYSGTTVAACCVNLERRKSWFAHTGDSLVVLGDLANGRVAFCTKEHKAHDPEEAPRLKNAGAQVIEKRYGDGEVISRVFIPRTGVPGLAMSRSLGDGCLKRYGVIAQPEVIDISGFWDECEEPVVMIASDGLWDVITVTEAMKALAQRRKSGVDVRLGAEVLCRRAQRLWIEEEEDYCDDTTVLIMIAASSSSSTSGDP